MPKKKTPTFVPGTQGKMWAANRAAKAIGGDPVPLLPIRKDPDGGYSRMIDGQRVEYIPYQVNRES